MDAFSIGLILRQLIAAGLPFKTLAGIVILGGGVYLFVVMARYVAGLFDRILATRDSERAAFAAQQNQIVSALMERVTESDRRRAVIEAAATRSLANITSAQERIANELGRFRDETVVKLGDIEKDIQFIKGRSS